MRLSDLQQGQEAVIVKILGHGAFRKRVMEMGFVRGRKIKALLSAPLRDPIKYTLMGYEVSLRRSEARMIEIVPVEDFTADENSGALTTDCDIPHPSHSPSEQARRVINVALIGNPNCGKTSLFNIASGATEHVGNYSGVTVDCKEGSFTHSGYKINIVDLPGTYSLSAYSPEELYIRRYLKENNPDIILNVVDASNLERNLYLTTELIDMDHSMVIALNMFDELRNRDDRLDYEQLGDMIGVPLVPTVSRTGEGLDKLFDTVIEVYEGRNRSVRHVHVNVGEDVERAVTVLKDILKADHSVSQHVSPRYLAIKLLEQDNEADKTVAEVAGSKEIFRLRDELVAQLEKDHSEDINSIIANKKYGFIAGALAETMTRNEQTQANTTRIIDAFVTNRLFGFPIFIIIMFFIFWMTFYVGQFPMGWIESGCGALSNLVSGAMTDGPLKDLIVDGIIGGVGGVIVFLPNILILYFFISFMEDSGYMARAAFIMDKLMHKIGLHGKSFIPLVMGFGCNVPAVMACRSIESRSSRLITVLINPFISCSARLPVYVLLIGTFFDRYAAFVFLCVYLLGIIIAVITARLLRRFIFKKDETPFVMELPPYRMPTFKSSVRHMWWKAKQYLKKMGGIILVASIIVWALNYFPRHEENQPDAINMTENSKIDPSRDSYLEMMGKAVNPILAPLGFSWKATVATIAGVPAKEIVVSTLSVLYTGEEVASDKTIAARITARAPDGRPDFTAPVALSFMVFILLYCPCIATIVAIVKETGRRRYGLFTIVYNTAVAWVIAFIVYRIALLFC